MLEDLWGFLLGFLHDRSGGAVVVYSLFAPFYYAALVAITLLPFRLFPRRGRLLVALLGTYLLVNLLGESLADSVARARGASNASAIRMLLVAGWFGVVFTVIYSLQRQLARTKKIIRELRSRRGT